jgi:hypothetical protein
MLPEIVAGIFPINYIHTIRVYSFSLFGETGRDGSRNILSLNSAATLFASFRFICVYSSLNVSKIRVGNVAFSHDGQIHLIKMLFR